MNAAKNLNVLGFPSLVTIVSFGASIYQELAKRDKREAINLLDLLYSSFTFAHATVRELRTKNAARFSEVKVLSIGGEDVGYTFLIDGHFPGKGPEGDPSVWGWQTWEEAQKHLGERVEWEFRSCQDQIIRPMKGIVCRWYALGNNLVNKSSFIKRAVKDRKYPPYDGDLKTEPTSIDLLDYRVMFSDVHIPDYLK